MQRLMLSGFANHYKYTVVINHSCSAISNGTRFFPVYKGSAIYKGYTLCLSVSAPER